MQCPYKARLRVGSTGSLIDVDCALTAGHKGPCRSILDVDETGEAEKLRRELILEQHLESKR